MLSALTVRKDQSFGFVTSESFRHPSSFCLIEESVVRHRVISCVLLPVPVLLCRVTWLRPHKVWRLSATTFLLFISMFVSFSLDGDSV